MALVWGRAGIIWRESGVVVKFSVVNAGYGEAHLFACPFRQS